MVSKPQIRLKSKAQTDPPSLKSFGGTSEIAQSARVRWRMSKHILKRFAIRQSPLADVLDVRWCFETTSNSLPARPNPTILIFFLSLITVFGFHHSLYADDLGNHLNFEMASKKARGSESKNSALPIFSKDRLSLQFVWGKLYSPFLLGTDSPDFDYAQANLRVGWMIDDPTERKFFWRGNFEALLEITYDNVIEGTGSYLAGVGALIRYNIVSADNIIRPFVQVGGGIVLTDVYKNRSQELIGQSYQFDLRAGVGIRVAVANNWSIDFEGIYNHISNGGLSERNDGVNAGGVLVGVTYYFDSFWK